MKKSATLTGVFAILLVIVITGTSIAGTGRKFAVHSEVTLQKERQQDYFFSTSDLPTDEPRVKIGVRWYGSDRLGIDLGFGLTSVSWVDEDTATGTSEKPGRRSIMTGIGFVYEILKGEKASLGLLGRLSLNFNQWFEYYSYWSPPLNFNKYEKYNVTIPKLFLGLEPSYYFSRSFSAFSHLGLSITFVPSSKRVDYGELPPIVQPLDEIPLIDRNDSKTKIRTDGITIGLRYHF